MYHNTSQGGGQLVQKRYFRTVSVYNSGAGTPTELIKYFYDEFGREQFVIQDRDGNWGSTDDRRKTTNNYVNQGRLTRQAILDGGLAYRLNLSDAVAYNSEHNTYIYPFGDSESATCRHRVFGECLE